LKTWLFLGLFFALIIFVGWGVAYFYQSPAILYLAIVLAIFLNIFSYWFSDKIVLKLHKAKLATRAEYFDLWNAVENLSITAGLPMPKLYVIEDSSPNAFATGRNVEHAVICVTSGLLRILDKNELEGVIAHELSHVGNRDMLLSTIVVVMAGFVALISDIFLRSSFWHDRGKNQNSTAGGMTMVIGLTLAILTPLAATLIQLAISRKREFLADASGALLTRYPEGLASALRKICANPAPLHTANNATAHLFISNPFGNRPKSMISKLFLTHPPVEERIRALMDSQDAGN
jgi:heat shock protein HtpX